VIVDDDEHRVNASRRASERQKIHTLHDAFATHLINTHTISQQWHFFYL